MPRDSRRKPHEERQEAGSHSHPLPVRSPALEAAERRRAGEHKSRVTGEHASLRPLHHQTPSVHRNESRRMAREPEMLEVHRPMTPRKALPRPKKARLAGSARGTQGAQELTVDWRTRGRLHRPEPASATAAAISEE